MTPKPPEFFYVTLPGDDKIRGVQFAPQGNRPQNTTVVFLQGRGAFMEKNQEFLEDLARKGFKVFAFDWPGQGGSYRLLSNMQKGYVDTFDTYLKALDHFITTGVRPHTEGPIILVGASMGGNLALRYTKEYPGKISGTVLAAPMLDIITDPYPRWFARFISKAACWVGACRSYAFGKGDYDATQQTAFDKNDEIGDAKRYEIANQIMKDMPKVVIGGPTFGWIRAAFESMDKIQEPGYLEAVQTPVFLASAGLDQIVNNHEDKQMCARMRQCTHKLYPDAFHNIPLDKDAVRNDFLDQVVLFSHNLSKTTP